jgi:hypothetical protein
MEGCLGLKAIVLTGILVVLAGCGANGDPLRPTASSNLSIGTNGVSAGTNLAVTNGFFSVGIGQTIYRR